MVFDLLDYFMVAQPPMVQLLNLLSHSGLSSAEVTGLIQYAEDVGYPGEENLDLDKIPTLSTDAE